MGNDNNQDEYNLYTEKIVEPVTKKYRKVIKCIKYAVGVVLLSAIAAVVFYYVYNWLDMKNGGTEIPTKKVINIPNDDYTKATEKATEESTEETTDTENVTAASKPDEQASRAEAILSYEANYNTIATIANDAYKSLVTVSAVVNTSEIFETVYESETMGVVIVNENDLYYILTSYDVVANVDGIEVRLFTGEKAKASFVEGDPVTDLAIITVPEESFSAAVKRNITVMPMGNSYFVGTNSPLIAVGNICNGNFTMNYGIASNMQNVIYDVDSKYGIINTNIAKGSNSSGVLINTNGELVGVITDNYANKYGDSLINAYGISYLKSLISQLSNGNKVLYMGIDGREVNSDTSANFGMPKGIYISNVKVNSPAHKAGLQGGDIITKIGNDKTETFIQYKSAMFAHTPGENVTITVARRGNVGYKELEFSIVLEEKK